jgi:hypothetical protein
MLTMAVIRSGEKTIDYADMSYVRDSYILRSTEPPDTVIRMGRNIPPLIEKALKYTSSPFYILSTYILFTGFGFYENGSLKYIGFSNSEPVLFSNIEDFVKYRLGKKYKKYLKNKNH